MEHLGCIHAPNSLSILGILVAPLLDVAHARNNHPLVVVALAASLVPTLGL